MDSPIWRQTLTGWNDGAGPLHSRLRLAMRSAIERADVAPGTRLPAERALAEELGVSRTTVVAAYTALRNDRWIESRRGSGTWVTQRSAHAAPSVRERELSSAFNRNTIFRDMLREDDSSIDFLAAHLDAAPELGPMVREFVAEGTSELLSGHGYAPLGLPILRTAVAQYLSESGLPTSEEQVLITNGAQQAIGLTAALFVDRGDMVALEDPSYLGAIDAYNVAGARLVSIPLGPDGADVGCIRDAIATGARLVYLMPTFQNPTGTVMAEPVRRAVARVAEETQVPIVEDHVLSDLLLDLEPPAPIAVHAPDGPILTIGSLSKLVWGGLRIGWIRAPEPMIARLARFKAVADLGGSAISQAVAARLLPVRARIQATRRQEIKGKLDALTSLLREHLPTWTFRYPPGGMLVWARLPHGDANDLAVIARRHGVGILAGSVNSPSARFADHVRLPAIHEASVMEEGIARLSAAWAVYESTSHERRQALGVLV